MITVTDCGPLGIKITCEPDDEYEYIRCDSSLAGLFYLRHRDNVAHVFYIKDKKGYWSEDSFPYDQMRNKDSCKITKVTEKISDIKLTKEQYNSIANN